MDAIETKQDWRENLSNLLGELRDLDIEATRQAKEESIAATQADAIALCERGKVALEAQGIEIERIEVVAEEGHTFSGIQCASYCWAKNYRFEVHGSSTDAGIEVSVCKVTPDLGVIVSISQRAMLFKGENLAWQRRLAEMLEALDQTEVNLRQKDVTKTDAPEPSEPEPSEPQNVELFSYRPQTFTVAENAARLANLAGAITNLPVNQDHILYRRLLLTLGDLYAEYARWVTPNTPAKPVENDEVPF